MRFDFFSIQNTSWKLFALAFLFFPLAACDTKSAVNFKGDRLVSSLPKTKEAEKAVPVSPSAGGYSKKTASLGSKVSLTMGAPMNRISGTTLNGYKVQFNLQGQLNE